MHAMQPACMRLGAAQLPQQPLQLTSGPRRNCTLRSRRALALPVRALGTLIPQRGPASEPTRVAAPAVIDPNVTTIRTSSQANRLHLGDIIADDGGPPRFISPFIATRRPGLDVEALPLMLYLPGIDGTGLAASRQFPGLVDWFDLRALVVPAHDRTPFPELLQIVEEYLEKEVSERCPPSRPVYLLGESFGGVLAIALAARRPDLADRLVLVNPATSFGRSPWPVLGPLLPQIPKDWYDVLPMALAPVLGNPIALASVGIDRRAPLANQAAALGENLQALLPQLVALKDILPAATLQWKLQLLAEGNEFVKDLFSQVQQRVLLLVGDRDLLIPSAQEGPRLARLLPRCTLQVMRGRSHALLQEGGVDLVAIMRAQGFYVQERKLSAPLQVRGRLAFGAPSAVELPTPQELDTASESTAMLRRLVSPVFFSRGSGGALQRGLGGVPAARPLLLVGNHQTYALDTGLMIEQFLREKGTLPRGLAHPVVFQGMRPPQWADRDGDSRFAAFMSTWGAVPVGGRNFFQLLRNGEAVLLYPGGVREAYKRKGEQYRLFWPQRAEFVRMAARFGATIVPFAGVGSEDGFELIADSADLVKLPLVGPWLEQRARESIPEARRGVAQAEGLDALFLQPLPALKAPQRYYYLFQEPIVTSPADLEDKQRCEEIYARVRFSVEHGIAELLQRRQQDPYREFLPRLLYEGSRGGQQAPTFPLPGSAEAVAASPTVRLAMSL